MLAGNDGPGPRSEPWLCLHSASAVRAADEPKRGGTAIVVIGADPAILNPNVTVGAPDVLTGCMLYDGLVRFAEGFHIVPSLAKSWEIAPDGLTYTFHLVAANWSDEQTSDIGRCEVHAARGQLQVRLGSSLPQARRSRLSRPPILRRWLSACPSRSVRSCSRWRARQNAAILPAHAFRGTDVLKNPASNVSPNQRGAIQLLEWVRGDHLTLVRSPNYWTPRQPYHRPHHYPRLFPTLPPACTAGR